MDDLSILATTAEVSVAFAGFIGIFLVLATRDGRFASRDAFSIRVIVICSVSPVFYSAVPLVLHSLGVSGATLWRISSGLVALACGAVGAYLVPQGRALEIARSLSVLVAWGLGVLSMLCLVANVLAWPWAPSGGLYIAAVWSGITVAGMSFVRLILIRVLD